MFHPLPDAFRVASPALPAALTAATFAVGLRGVAGHTLVETERGWSPVARLTAGTPVATLDGGFAEVAGLRRILPPGCCRHATVVIPGGAVGNCDDVVLGAGQEVLLPTGPAEGILDAAFALVPAASLAGHMGIRAGATDDALYQLHFAAEEVVWASSGLLLHCPVPGDATAFQRLDDARARALIGLLEDGTPFPAPDTAALAVAA